MDLQAETTNATSESALKVALDYGKAHGVIKSHDRVVICQKVGDSAVVKIMELEDWTGGAFLFDNILLLRSWAFEGFSNYQVSRSWAKMKKNMRVCTDTTMFTVTTQLRSKHQNHVVSFLVYVVGGCTNIYAML